MLHPNVKAAVGTLTWFPVLYVFLDHVYLPCRITGFSMTPTFNPGTETTARDVVLLQKYNLKKPHALVAGDIVMFRSPKNPEKLLTKRVVATQGQTVPCKYPYPKSETVVSRNHLWVEGDNLFHSIDSNTFGPISQGLVVGKVVMVLWPLSRLGASLEKR